MARLGTVDKKYINKKVNVSMLTFRKIHQILWFSIMFLKVFRKLFTSVVHTFRTV